MKKFVLYIVIIASSSYVNAQVKSDEVKSDYINNTNPFCIDFNIKFGALTQNASAINLLNAYNQNIPSLSNLSSPFFKTGATFGFDGNFSYFFGEGKHFGIGTGFYFQYQISNLWENNYKVQYQSTDSNNTIFRQIITSNGNRNIKETITSSNINIPIYLKYKTHIRKNMGFNADLGILYNMAFSNSYTTNASLDYEAAYRYALVTGTDKVVAVYDNSPNFASDDILFTKAHIKGDAAQNLDKLRSAGYNVGLAQSPNNGSGKVSFQSGSIGLIFKPSLSFGINSRMEMNFGTFMTYQNITHIAQNDYKLTNKVGEYNSLLNSITSDGNLAIGLNAGLRYYLNIKAKDSDGDGIPNKKDRCPFDSGLYNFFGCPDTDGDGIPDIDDSCKHEFGVLKFHGCPDSDGDGIMDKNDSCPHEFGLAQFNGCPDADGDGIMDSRDSCPHQAGLVKYNGCPDTDGDGIPDNLDNCPFLAGTPENNGCPANLKSIGKYNGKENLSDGGVEVGMEVNNKGTETPKNNPPTKKVLERKQIHFDFNKFSISKNSFQYLDNIVKLLKEYPETILTIDGYTDNVGPLSANIRMSRERALAVKRYMLKKGIEADRLKARGHGRQAPIANNRSKVGRAKNRRALLVVKSSDTNQSKVANSSAINVFPNQEKGSFTIILNTNFEENATVVITNSAGKKVKEFKIVANKPTEFTLEEPAGLYSFTASTSNTKYEARIIISK